MNHAKTDSHRASNHTRKLRTQQFYRQIDFAKWWGEFTSIQPNGHYTYPTAWSFAQAKASTDEQRRWIFWMIGLQPKAPSWLNHEDKKAWHSPVPWLGDWVARRAETLWQSTPETLGALTRAVEQPASAPELARSCADVPLGWLRKFEILAQRLDDYFVGNIFDPTLSLDDLDQRAGFYFKYSERAYKIIVNALEVYLRCHGIKSGDCSAMVVSNNNAVNTGNQAIVIHGDRKEAHKQLAAAGHAMATKPDAAVITPMTLAMAEMLVRKSLTFKRPLPDEDAMREVRKMQADGTLPKDLFGDEKQKADGK